MVRVLRALAITAVTATAFSLSPAASPALADPVPTGPAAATVDLAPGMLEAMRRDLRLDDRQVAARLRAEAVAPAVERRLRESLGAAFAGAWFPSGSDRLTVAVTTRDALHTAAAVGVDARLARHSERALAAAKSTLDGLRAPAGQVLRGWFVDVTANTVVIAAAPGASEVARTFAKAGGLPAELVTVIEQAEAARPLYDLRGGDQYVINGNTICSIGFSVVGGFVTAGHCGGVGAPTTGYNGVAQGNFAGSQFPGKDMAWVRTNSSWTPQPWVNNYAGGNVGVAGSQDAAIGSSICRSGRTTGWRCGTLLGRNETITYAQGSVSGLSRSNACAEPGDSGGAWISGNQAQGVTSGGTGNCSSGGTMWFQPVNPILSTYGLTLVTTGGGGVSIVSNWNNRCIDVPNSNFSDGVRLQMWNCNGTAAQKWTFSGGSLRTQNNKCMDVAWGSTANGAAIQIANCSGNPAQQFVLSGAGDLVNPQANKCVDIAGWNGNEGALLHLWECTGGANQKWRTA